jgi:acetyl-CoA acetyltransferase
MCKSLTGSTEAAAEMWSRTPLEPADVDIAELYDGFTFRTFAWLEALGLCVDGEAGPFVEGAARIQFRKARRRRRLQWWQSDCRLHAAVPSNGLITAADPT